MSKCSSHGTFSHFSLQSSHLYNCYYHQDLYQGPFRLRLRDTFAKTPASSYSSSHTTWPLGWV
jgi:hypothetical protein